MAQATDTSSGMAWVDVNLPMGPHDPKKSFNRREKYQFTMDDAFYYGEADWNLLPDVALLKLFSYLKTEDRLRAAQTCRRWANLIHESAGLWRRLDIDLTEKLFDLKAIWNVRRYAKHVRVLSFVGHSATIFIWPRLKRLIQACFALLPDSLREVRLQETDLTESPFDRCPSVPLLVQAIKLFLSKQNRLEKVEMTGTKVRLISAIEILEALTTHCQQTISVLNLTDYFHWCHRNIYARPRYIDVIGKFHNLKEIYLNYDCISDDILDTFGKNLSKTLEYLWIKVSARFSHNLSIRGSSWAKLRKCCPRLRAEFEFIHMYLPEDVITYLPTAVPLVALRIWTGYDIKRQFQIRQTVSYLLAFRSTLETLSLEIENTESWFDKSLILLVEVCKKLKDLTVCACVNIDTIRLICERRWKGKIGLQVFHVTLCCATSEEWDALFKLTKDNMENIMEYDVDFYFTTDLVRDLKRRLDETPAWEESEVPEVMYQDPIPPYPIEEFGPEFFIMED